MSDSAFRLLEIMYGDTTPREELVKAHNYALKHNLDSMQVFRKKLYIATNPSDKQENMESSKSSWSGHFKMIWDYLVNNKGKKFTSYEIANHLNIEKNTVRARIAQMKNCGLVKITGTAVFKNKAGKKINNRQYEPVSYDTFEKVEQRLKMIPRGKDLKYNSLAKQAVEKVFWIARDRSLTVEDRKKMAKAFFDSIETFIDKNAQVEDPNKSFLTSPHSYESIDNFVKEYDILLDIQEDSE